MRRNKMKLFSWIFSKKKEEEVKEEWTIEQNGWRANAKQYDDFIAHMRGQQ